MTPKKSWSLDMIPRWAQIIGATGAILSAVLFLLKMGLSVVTSYEAIGRASAQDSSQNYSIAQLIIMHADDQRRIEHFEKWACPRATALERRLLELDCR